MDPIRAAQDAIVAALKVGQAVPVYTRPPVNKPFPFIVVGHIVADQRDLFAKRLTELDATITVLSDQRGNGQVLDIMASIYDVLHEANLVLAAGHATTCMVTRRVSALDQDGLTETGNVELTLTLEH